MQIDIRLMLSRRRRRISRRSWPPRRQVPMRPSSCAFLNFRVAVLLTRDSTLLPPSPAGLTTMLAARYFLYLFKMPFEIELKEIILTILRRNLFRKSVIVNHISLLINKALIFDNLDKTYYSQIDKICFLYLETFECN